MTTFTQVPADNRSPEAFVEIDDSQSGASTGSIDHVLLLGHKATAAGTAPSNTLVDLTTIAEAEAAFGARSQLAAMMRAYLGANDQATIHAMATLDGGAAASGVFTVVGTATADGSIELYVGAQRFLVSVTSGDTETDVATAIAAALTADTDIPITAAAAVGVATCTSAWKGPTGAETILSVGANVPAGLTCVATTMSGGGAAPDISGAIAAFEADGYKVVTGVADTSSLDLLETEIATRWQAGSTLGGHVYGAISGTRTAAAAFGVLRNAPETTLMGTLGSITQPWVWAATIAAVDMLATIGAPRYQLELLGLVAAIPSARAQTNGQRNALLKSGISTYLVSGGKVLIDRLITTYQRDGGGGPDTTWLSLRTRQIVWELRQDWRARAKAVFIIGIGLIADDGTLVGEGVSVATPDRIKAEAVAWAREKEALGLIEKLDAFKTSLTATRNLTDPERVDMLITPDLVNELVTLATMLAFRI